MDPDVSSCEGLQVTPLQSVISAVHVILQCRSLNLTRKKEIEPLHTNTKHSAFFFWNIISWNDSLWISYIYAIYFMLLALNFPQTSQLHVFFSIFVLITDWVQLVLLTCAWLWGHQREHYQPTTDHIPMTKRNKTKSKPKATFPPLAAVNCH